MIRLKCFDIDYKENDGTASSGNWGHTGLKDEVGGSDPMGKEETTHSLGRKLVGIYKRRLINKNMYDDNDSNIPQPKRQRQYIERPYNKYTGEFDKEDYWKDKKRVGRDKVKRTEAHQGHDAHKVIGESTRSKRVLEALGTKTLNNLLNNLDVNVIDLADFRDGLKKILEKQIKEVLNKSNPNFEKAKQEALNSIKHLQNNVHKTKQDYGKAIGESYNFYDENKPKVKDSVDKLFKDKKNKLENNLNIKTIDDVEKYFDDINIIYDNDGLTDMEKANGIIDAMEFIKNNTSVPIKRVIEKLSMQFIAFKRCRSVAYLAHERDGSHPEIEFNKKYNKIDQLIYSKKDLEEIYTKKKKEKEEELEKCKNEIEKYKKFSKENGYSYSYDINLYTEKYNTLLKDPVCKKGYSFTKYYSKNQRDIFRNNFFHEFGHAIELYFKIDVSDIYKKHKHTDDMTEYSKQDQKEFFAESHVSYCNGEENEIDEEIKKILDKFYDKKNKED